MKRAIISIVVALIFSAPLMAQDEPVVVNSKIKSVTIFTDRALVTRVVPAALEPGSHRLEVHGLPTGLVDNSMRVSGKGTVGAKIAGVKVEKALKEETSSDRMKEIESQIAALELRNNELTDRSGVLGQESEFIKALSQKTAESISKGLPAERPSATEWPTMIKFVDDNLTRINKELRAVEIEKRDIAAQRALLDSKLGDYRAGNIKSDKNAVIDLSVTEAGSFSFELSYMIYGASWRPTYDIRAWSDTNEIEVIFMAQVNQQTGEDWENVNLVLSTARPSEGANPPVLTAIYLTADAYGKISGLVTDEKGEPLPGVSIRINGTSMGTATNYDGSFVIYNVPPGDYSLSAQTVGYNKMTVLGLEVQPHATTEQTFKLTSLAIQVQDIVVTAGKGASRARGGRAGEIADTDEAKPEEVLKFMPSLIQAPTQYSSSEIVQTAISTSFTLEKKESIPSNKEFKKVPVKSVSFVAETENYIVPKLSEAAYLKASVKSNVDFPLLAGQANVFFDNNFVSTSHLPNVLTDEKFDLYFGINEGIRVKRELVKKFVDEAGLTGGKQKIDYEYKIKTENYTRASQKLIVLDQIPVTQNDDIDVKLVTVNPEPTYETDDKAKGFLRWITKLNPGDKSEYTFKYQIKYPDKMMISGLE